MIAAGCVAELAVVSGADVVSRGGAAVIGGRV